MKETLRQYFIPQEGNNYHPHILHTKRTVFYGGALLFTKIIVVVFTLLLPLDVFVIPDVLEEQRRDIIALTNALRQEEGLDVYAEHPTLDISSRLKAEDMAVLSYFSHVSPEGKNVRSFLRESGYTFRAAGENLGMGFSSALSVMTAWKNSPTHFANLVDSEFEDIGVSLAAGEYNDIPTIYVVQHFGVEPGALPPDVAASEQAVAPAEQQTRPVTEEPNKPQQNSVQETPPVVQSAGEPASLPPAPAEQPSQPLQPAESEPPVSTPPQSAQEEIEGESVVEDAPLPQTEALPAQESAQEDAPESEDTASENTALPEPAPQEADPAERVPAVQNGAVVSWEEVDAHSVLFSATVPISGTVQSAEILLGQHRMPLFLADAQSGVYAGQTTISTTPEAFFRVVIPPIARITDAHGRSFDAALAWERVPIVSPTPMEKYLASKASLGVLTSIFDVSKMIYGAFAVFLIIALLLNIFIEIRRQHHHVIAQTLVLIVFTAFLFAV